MEKLVFLEPDDVQETPFTTSKVIAEHGKGCVYILDLGNDMVKIGQSINPETRVLCISTQSGFSIRQWCKTELCNNYKDIEKAIHNHFKNKRVHGEWFKVSFQKAKAYLQTMKLDTSIKPEKTVNYADFFGESDRIRLENEIRESYTEHLKSLLSTVYENVKLYGYVDNEIQRKCKKACKLFDVMDCQIERQISVLIELGYSYKEIKYELSKAYLQTA